MDSDFQCGVETWQQQQLDLVSPGQSWHPANGTKYNAIRCQDSHQVTTTSGVIVPHRFQKEILSETLSKLFVNDVIVACEESSGLLYHSIRRMDHTRKLL